jgi:hypothetical protein
MMHLMVKALEQAIAEIATLPDAEQEEIGRRLLSHMQKLRQLREEIDHCASLRDFLSYAR